MRGEPGVPADGAADRREHARPVDVRPDVRHDDHARNAGQAADDRRDLVGQRQRLAVVPVAVDGEDHLGLDLAEAVEHALDAEIGRARRPDGAEARRAQHGDDRLGHVRQVAGDAIARSDALLAQRRGHARDGRNQLCMRNAPRDLVFATKDQRIAGVVGRPAGEQVFREVEARVGEPARPGHAVAVDERALAAHADNAGVVPQRAPERFLVGHRPAPERRIIGERDTRRGRELAGEIGQCRLRDARRRWLPQQVGRFHVVRDLRGHFTTVRSDAAMTSGNGAGRPVTGSSQTIFAAPSAYFAPFIPIS